MFENIILKSHFVQTLIALSPESFLLLTAIQIFFVDFIFNKKSKTDRLFSGNLFTLLGMSLALISSVMTLHWANHENILTHLFRVIPSSEQMGKVFDNGFGLYFSRTIMIDPISQYFKVILIFSSMVVLLQGMFSKEIRPENRLELNILIVLSLFGMCLFCSAIHFLLLFLSFQMVGISLTVLVSIKTRSKLSTEAGVKIFFSQMITSVFFILGVLLLYGVSKSFNILDIREILNKINLDKSFLWITFGFFFCSMAAQAGIFPFHTLMPDVAEGAPAPVSSFFSVTTIVAFMCLFLRLCLHLFSLKSQNQSQWIYSSNFGWPDFIAVVAAITMTLTSLATVFQKNLKRMIGYSVCSQMGYLLIGLSVLNNDGIVSFLFSILAYSLVVLGVFFAVQLVCDAEGSEEVGILNGLVWRNPYEAVALGVFLLSLSGLPPFIGFIGKFHILSIAMREKLYWLSIVAVFNLVLGLTYSLYMMREIFSSKNKNDNAQNHIRLRTNRLAQVILAILVFPTIVLGIYWDPLMNYLNKTLSHLQW